MHRILVTLTTFWLHAHILVTGTHSGYIHATKTSKSQLQLTHRDWSHRSPTKSCASSALLALGDSELLTAMKHSVHAFLTPQIPSSHRLKNLGNYKTKNNWSCNISQESWVFSFNNSSPQPTKNKYNMENIGTVKLLDLQKSSSSQYIDRMTAVGRRLPIQNTHYTCTVCQRVHPVNLTTCGCHRQKTLYSRHS